MALRYLDMEALKAAPVAKEPFEFFVVPGFVRPEVQADINRDYPKIAESGSFPVASAVAAAESFRSSTVPVEGRACTVFQVLASFEV